MPPRVRPQVRILFPPLWSGQHFDEFSESYHTANYELDAWLKRLIEADDALEGRLVDIGRFARLRQRRRRAL